MLYTAAYQHHFGKLVPSKEHYQNAAKKASIYDISNFSRYVSELSKIYVSELSEGYKLNPDGDTEVQKIIARMQDKNVEAGYEYWGRPATPLSKRYRLGKDDQNKIKEWVKDDVQLGELDVRQIKNPRDYALVALWILTVHLKKADAVRWNDAYYYFKERFITISATPKLFSKAISRSANVKYFSRTGELYYLTIEGQQKVEGWISGKPIEKKSDKEG